MKDIIEALYNGEVYPCVHSDLNQSRYRKASNIASEKEQEFLNSLADYDKGLLDNYLSAQALAEYESEFSNFTLGFKLGSRFALSMTTKLDYDE